jgi:hypothetical protein
MPAVRVQQPPHPGEILRERCLEPLNLLQRTNHPRGARDRVVRSQQQPASDQ